MATKRLIDLVGQRFGKLVVVEYAGRNERRESLWRCACDCGNESIVRGDVLRRGTTESCGCGKGLKHGYHKKRWYSSYKAMMERCYLPSNENFKRYGGKGIIVCDEWHDINKFAEWVETSGYVPGLTIDRIDPLGNYEPSNCQWLTRSENSKKQFVDRKKRAKEMVEVVHGEWSTIEDDYVGMTALQCSECNQEYWFEEEPPLKTYNYCPNCGAKMDGDGNA
jgi:DNA-directed RNA polymerase subunit RPC12/RpoP